MSPDRQPPLSLVRRLVVANLDKPVLDIIDSALDCLVQALDARAAFLGKIDGETLEIVAAQVESGQAIEPGTRLPLEDTFGAAEEESDGGLINVRDASKRQPFKRLAMRQQFGIISYLGTPLRNAEGEVTGTLAVLGKSARVYTAEEQDLLLVVAGLLRPRLQPASKPLNGQSRTPVSAVRLASQEVKEPLAILRGYADMLNNNEVPPDQMPIVARRLAEQSETLMRIADQVLLLSRLPLELAFTVRVPLDAVAQASAQRIRQRMAGAGMELRLQLDSQAEVWGGARRDAPQRVQARAQRNRRPASPAADDPRSLPVDRQGRRPGNVGRPAGRALQPTGGRATGPWRGARAVPPAAGGRGARGPGLGKQPGGQRHNLLSGTAGGVAGRRYRAGLGRRS